MSGIKSTRRKQRSVWAEFRYLVSALFVVAAFEISPKETVEEIQAYRDLTEVLKDTQ